MPPASRAKPHRAAKPARPSSSARPKPRAAARPKVKPSPARPAPAKSAKKPAPPKSAPAKSAPTATASPAPSRPPANPDGRRHVLSLSFLRDGDEFLARTESDAGQITEFKHRVLDQLLSLVASELEDLLE